MKKQNIKNPYSHKNSAIVCYKYKSVRHWQKALNPEPYKILSKEKMQQEKHTHCFVFSSHSPPPFFFKRRDYFKSEMSLIP